MSCLNIKARGLSQKVWRYKFPVDKVTFLSQLSSWGGMLMNYWGLSKVDYFLQTIMSKSSWSHFNHFDSQDWNAAVVPLLIMIKLAILTWGHSHWRAYMYIHSHNGIVTKVCKVIIRFGSNSWWWDAVPGSVISCDRAWLQVKPGCVRQDRCATTGSNSVLHFDSITTSQFSSFYLFYWLDHIHNIAKAMRFIHFETMILGLIPFELVCEQSMNPAVMWLFKMSYIHQCLFVKTLLCRLVQFFTGDS